ncbi:hypothetical protein [Anaeroselena agilis]|uniref:DUF4136 domain-containing protein n=1 Tax=Anaeroselena agilis TaxID=3063788 RepID=A0ABU3NXN5_9FIRM|nr:hypothetical protein [Selenomonadales bacterium 4137-cl]
MPRKIICIAACLWLLLIAPCGAEEKKEEWADKSCDFTMIRTVAVRLAVDDGLNISEIERRKLNDLVDSRIIRSGDQRVKFIAASQLEESIGKTIGADLGLLRFENRDKYAAVMREYAPQFADAVLTVAVKTLSTTQVYVPESIRYYTTYEKRYISVPAYTHRGTVYYTTQEIRVPVQRSEVQPAHYEYFGHAGAEFALARSRDGKKIWLLLDMRDGQSKVPIEMTERIFKRAMDRFRAVADNRLP